MRTERFQSLADNVFAVALTLLALQLPLPHGSRDLAHELTRQWPFYAAYVVSFVTVAIVWISGAAAFALYAFVAIFYAVSGRRNPLPGVQASHTRATPSYRAGPGG